MRIASNRSVIFVWCAILIAESVMLVYGEDNWEITSLFLALGSLTVIFRLGTAHLLSYMSVFVLLEFTVKPFYIVFMQSDALAFTFINSWNYILVYQLFGFGLFFIGFLISSKHNGFIQREFPYSIDIGLVILIYAVIWICRILFIFSFYFNNSVVGQIASMSPIVVAGLIFYAIQHRGYIWTKVFIAITFVLLELTWCLITKTKLPLLTDFLSFIFSLSIYRKIKFRYLIIGGLSGILFMGIIQFYREPGIYGGLNLFLVGLFNLVTRSDNFDTAIRVFNVTSYAQSALGKSMYIALFQNTLLPLPFPGKMYLPVGNIVANMYYGLHVRSLFIGFGLATSFYVSFGYIGGIIFMGILGIVVSRAVDLLLSHRPNFLRLGILVLIVIAISDVEEDYYTILDRAVKSIYVFLVIYTAWLILNGRKDSTTYEKEEDQLCLQDTIS